jgi:hypothetical protein
MPHGPATSITVHRAPWTLLLYKTTTSGVLAPPIPLATALVAHSPHHTTGGKEKGEEEEEKRGGARNVKPSSSPPPKPVRDEGDAAHFLLHHGTALHGTATVRHCTNSPCTDILSPSPPTVSSPSHLARRRLSLTWNHLAGQHRGSSSQNPRPSRFDRTLTHTWCAHSLAWPSHRGLVLAAACRCTTRSRHGRIKSWRGVTLDTLGNRRRKKRRTRSRTRSHSCIKTKHHGTEREGRGNAPP